MVKNAMNIFENLLYTIIRKNYHFFQSRRENCGFKKTYFLRFLTVQEMCASNPCLHEGTCIEMDNNTFKCLCVAGWKGEHCHGMSRPQK